MSSSLWLVFTRCTDASREAEFNRWYDEFHIPDMLSVPHVVAAQRFTVAGFQGQIPASPGHLAVYELDVDDPEKVAEAVSRDYVPRWRAAGRMIDCMESLASTRVTALSDRRLADAGAIATHT
jgi:hypothetical protein